MTVTAAQFRLDYPEFQNVTTYPDSQITYWLTLGLLLVNVNRWGQLFDLGVSLFIAHNISLEARAQAEAANGGIPGGIVGPVSSKSVGSVSVSYDTGAGIVQGAGHWNMSIYGTRFIKLARMFGAGPVQIGMGAGSGLGAWPGPDCTPAPTGFGG